MSADRATAGHSEPGREPAHPPGLAEQFDDLRQQREAATLGMWVFLSTEVLMFGGLFTTYAVYQSSYPVAFHQGSQHLYTWIGVANTAVLLTSSFFVALAVHALKDGFSSASARNLFIAAGLGGVFLVLKIVEYYLDVHEGLLPWYRYRAIGLHPQHVRLFLVFYWFMTGLHALHMIIGVIVLMILGLLTRRGRYSAAYHNPVEVGGLYWHFVDIVWIFLLPTLYLVSPAT